MDGEEIVRKVLEASGFQSLNPPQQMAIKAGLLEGRNLVVATPTASGKTIIAEIACLKAVAEGKKAVYIVPLKALASEKYEEFKSKYGPMGIRVAISIGDLDSGDDWLSGSDIIITTSEKLDSLLRHDVRWAEDIGLVVADEVHLLDSAERGPTLEVVLTRINQIARPRMLALSATISNYKDLAAWLGAEGICSDYRPVMLYRGLCFNNSVDFVPKRKIKLEGNDEPTVELVEKTIKNGKQALVFVSTRRYAESAADKIGERVNALLSPEEKATLDSLAADVESALDHATAQCRKLANAVRQGVAFHHAGETSKQRKLVEDAFRKGTIKVITATPTLAFGLNLPAQTVIIRDIKRFSSYKGMDYLPVLEIHQMMGRSGRPKYDNEGQAIIIAKTKEDADYCWKRYINGEPEGITSKLGVEPVLRMHALALIASAVTPTKKDLLSFFSRTFYGHQFGDMGLLEGKLDRVLDLLESFGFIEREGRPASGSDFMKASAIASERSGNIKPTKFGRRVSELYIDPLTADHLIKEVKASSGFTPLALLQTIANTIEMKPLPSVTKKDGYLEEAVLSKDLKAPNEWDPAYDDFIRSVKLACVMNSWVEEVGEDRIMEEFGMTPGELRSRLENADWLLYALSELTMLLGKMDMLRSIRKMRVRIKYGVMEELLPLIRLKGIGRARARMLYRSGLKSIDDLRKVPLESLEKALGPKTARDVKDQLGELTDDDVA